VLGEGSHAVEPGPTGPTAWLRRNRYRLAIWTAIVEGLLVWISDGLDFSTVVVLAAVAALSVFVHRLTREHSRSPLLNELTWLLAASQLGAAVLVLAGHFLFGLLVLLLIAFAVAALAILLLERRR
jgi:hypothetical protein